MRLATTVALALCVALPAPIAANVSDGVTPIHRHRIHMHQAVHGRDGFGDDVRDRPGGSGREVRRQLRRTDPRPGPMQSRLHR
jgi:hypothetical protein